MISKGILAFAQGRDFLRLAVLQLEQIRKFSDIEVAYIVDTKAAGSPEFNRLQELGCKTVVFDSQVQCRNYDLGTEWRNLGREHAFELSPFDRTLLVDVDYILQSSAAIDLLEADLPLVCGDWHHSFDQEFILDKPCIGRHGVPMLWATLFWFDKSPRSQQIFHKWQEALKFMKWKQEYYGFHSSLIRNDYALSIAVHELEQETQLEVARAAYSQHAIPTWCTYELVDSNIVVTSTTNDRPAQVVNLNGVDFHALNKRNFLEIYQ